MINQFQLHDLFATKGLEYLLIIAYLISFIFFWRYLDGRGRALATALDRITFRVIDWFRIAEGRFYHPGHTWVLPTGRLHAVIGMDDFAQKLIGKADIIQLPEPGARIRRGEVAWRLDVGGKTIPVLAPVNGEVLSVNKAALNATQTVHDAPYGEGWLMKVRVPRLDGQLKKLLSGPDVDHWMKTTVERISELFGGGPAPHGVLLQDGGAPLSGFARELRPGDWDTIVRELLLTAETPSDAEGNTTAST